MNEFMTLEQAEKVLAHADCLWKQNQIEVALDRLSMSVTEKLADKNPLVLCSMNGGIIIMGHLLTRLSFALQIDYIHVTRYRGTTRGGKIAWLAKPQKSVRGQTVLIVDDILDEGYTLKAMQDYCRENAAREILSLVLVEKIHDRRIADLHVDFIGLQVEDRYVFGFGMDYNEYYRNLPHIYAVKED